MKNFLVFIVLFFLHAAGLFAENPEASSYSVKRVEESVCPDSMCFMRLHADLGEDALGYFFDRAEYRDNIVRIMSRPGTSRPWHVFRTHNVSAGQIPLGITFLRENRAWAEHAAKQYGVPAEVLTAVLGIETRYGKNTGSFAVADALYTLAFFYPKRAELFQKELREFLLMSRALGRDPFSFVGSYAGAMGMPQFMPSSYRKWAKDGDGDGFADIWQSKADALASVANYLNAHGWQSGKPIRVAVSLRPDDQIESIIREKTALTHTVGDFRRLGVKVPDEIGDEEPAVLYRLEDAPNEFSYYVGLNNFYVIWQYNHSRLYVEAVTRIAEGIAAGGQ